MFSQVASLVAALMVEGATLSHLVLQPQLNLEHIIFNRMDLCSILANRVLRLARHSGLQH